MSTSGSGMQEPELALAAGGQIRQTVVRDTSAKEDWDPTKTVVFNVQLLNSTCFSAVTGLAPPTSPITVQMYKANHVPYFTIYNEQPTGIRGNFSGVKSVNTIDKTKTTPAAKRAVAEVDKSFTPPTVELTFDGILNRNLTTILPFRHISDIEKSVQAFNTWDELP